MSIASTPDVVADGAAPPIADVVADQSARPATDEPSAGTEAAASDSDDACFRQLLEGLDEDGLVADQIRRALDQELDSETLLDRLALTLADEGATDAELGDAIPTLAAITIRHLLQALGTDQPEPALVEELTPPVIETIRTLIETGVPGAIQALPGMTRQLIHRAARDHIGGIDLIPVLRLIAERVALDPDLVRRLSGRGPLSRPLATAPHGAAKFRQQPMRCRIDGPVEIIIVRR